MELIVACQALDFSRPLKSSQIIEKLHEKVRNEIPHYSQDEIFAEDIEKAIQMIKNKVLLEIIKDK